jgi:hypothetical protein
MYVKLFGEKCMALYTLCILKTYSVYIEDLSGLWRFQSQPILHLPLGGFFRGLEKLIERFIWINFNNFPYIILHIIVIMNGFTCKFDVSIKYNNYWYFFNFDYFIYTGYATSIEFPESKFRGVKVYSLPMPGRTRHLLAVPGTHEKKNYPWCI